METIPTFHAKVVHNGEAMTEGRLDPKRCSFCGKEDRPLLPVFVKASASICLMCVTTIWNEYNAEMSHLRDSYRCLEQARVLGGHPARLLGLAGRRMQVVGFDSLGLHFGAPGEYRYLEQSRALGYPASRWKASL